VQELARRIGAEFHDLRLTTIEPQDLRGLPYYDHEALKTRWYRPEDLPDRPEEPAILFLDELTAAAPSLQPTVYGEKVGDPGDLVAGGEGAALLGAADGDHARLDEEDEDEHQERRLADWEGELGPDDHGDRERQQRRDLADERVLEEEPAGLPAEGPRARHEGEAGGQERPRRLAAPERGGA
jgi:hypothetical protein